eukprot:488577-Prymnesium_polylepis.1
MAWDCNTDDRFKASPGAGRPTERRISMRARCVAADTHPGEAIYGTACCKTALQSAGEGRVALESTFLICAIAAAPKAQVLVASAPTSACMPSNSPY